jgi:sialic acid synthase SpsE
LTNLPLIKEYALQKLPLIISAGMADLKEIKDAVKTILETGNNKLIILHCVSLYPAEPEEANLRKIETIKKNFKTVVGFSDHTEGILTAIAAVALGAKIIEKHFTLDKNMSGPDHHFSADPKELKDLVMGIRYVEKTMGSSAVKPTEREKEIKKYARRSIVASQNIKKGDKITDKLIEYKRPGTGIPPKLSSLVIGKIAKSDIGKDELITFKRLR